MVYAKCMYDAVIDYFACIAVFALVTHIIKVKELNSCFFISPEQSVAYQIFNTNMRTERAVPTQIVCAKTHRSVVPI